MFSSGRLPTMVDQIKEAELAWKKPSIKEIALGGKINLYACSERQ